MADTVARSEVVEVIARALDAPLSTSDAISLPTVLLPRRWFSEEAKGPALVDDVKYWLGQHGFSAERSYQDGSHGYTELFRELGSWYPWNIQAIRQAHADERQLRHTVAERLPQLAWPEALEAVREELFQERLTLLQATTEDEFHSLYEAIFNSWDDEDGHFIEDGGPPRVGAPDLFVWHLQPDLPT